MGFVDNMRNTEYYKSYPKYLSVNYVNKSKKQQLVSVLNFHSYVILDLL